MNRHTLNNLNIETDLPRGHGRIGHVNFSILNFSAIKEQVKSRNVQASFFLLKQVIFVNTNSERENNKNEQGRTKATDREPTSTTAQMPRRSTVRERSKALAHAMPSTN